MPADPDAMRLIDLIERSSARLEQAGVSFGHGTTNAFDEAAWLVLWKLGLPLDDLDGVAERALSAEQCAGVEAIVTQRIASRQPAAYLTGEAWLQGVPFHVDKRTIVPRSLIAEVLCEGAIDPWLEAAGVVAPKVLDLCTGNGSLAVLAALCWPEAQVDGTDLSAEALAVAEDALATVGISAVFIEVDAVDLVAGRRLQLACEARGSTGLVIHRKPWGGASPATGTGSAAASRWRIRPAPSLPPPGEFGLGPPRWQASLDRCRGGRPGTWLFEADHAYSHEAQDGTHPLRLVAPLGAGELVPATPVQRSA